MPGKFNISWGSTVDRDLVAHPKLGVRVVNKVVAVKAPHYNIVKGIFSALMTGHNPMEFTPVSATTSAGLILYIYKLVM